MDLLHGHVKTIYFKYLSAAFGSAMISSIYGIVDMAMVGQYQGPLGTAALAVVAPIWNIIYSLGLLTGIGGSILMSTAKGGGLKKQENEFFTAALVETGLFSLLCWFGVIFFQNELLQLFGANETLLPLAQQYLYPVQFCIPLFLFNQMLAAFLRNDNHPSLATIAVLIGGIFNIFGDYFFVFTLDMGIMGAGLATSLGALMTLLILLTHFISHKNTLKLVKLNHFLPLLKRISITGFSTFFIDIAMGILTMLFNRQIITYLGTDALSVYGVIVNISTVVQCCAYSVGQAAQPILSLNFGAKQWSRIKETLKYALYSIAFFSLVWTLLIFIFPNLFIQLFMTPTQDIYQIAPRIMRTYGLSFLLLPLNIFSTYYFQSIMKPGISFVVSITRGMILSGILIYILPIIFVPSTLWLTMPITELILAIFVIIAIRQSSFCIQKD